MTMYNLRSRLNIVMTHTMAVMGVCAFLMAASTVVTDLVMPPVPTGTIKPQLTRLGQAEIGSVRFNNRRLIDRTVIFVEGQADFTPCFSWNTKQLFVFVVLEYTTKRMKRNQMTIYDHIIEKKTDGILEFPRVAEYYLDDIQSDSLKGTEVTMKLMYHTMTYSGYAPIREVESARTTFTLQDEYATG